MSEAYIPAYEAYYKADSRDPSQAERLAIWKAACGAIMAALRTPAAAPISDEQYADADALVAHLDGLMDDGGQGGEKWEPAQAAIAGIRAWQASTPAAPDDALLVQAARATATTWREQASILKAGRKTLIRCAAELEAMVAAIHTRSTPAAPGIDPIEAIQTFARAYKAEVPHAELTVHGIDAGLRAVALIAASPKGGSEAVSVKRNCPPPSWMFPDDGDVPADWRAKAAAWLEEQAIEQENTNAAYPAHAVAYPSWGDRVHWLRTLSAKVAQAQASDAEVRP